MSQVLIDRALLKQALEALAKNLTRYASQPSSIWRYFYPSATGDYVNLREFMERAEPIITALRAALAQEEQEQEPVAWYDGRIFYGSQAAASLNCADMAALMPLYTHPPRREWQGLSEGEIVECDQRSHGNTDWGKKRAFAHAIETALKERNHD